MLSKQPSGTPPAPKPFVERRRDALTRSVLNGLEKLQCDMEKLSEGPDKHEALAAVSRYAQSIAEAITRAKAGTPPAPAKAPAPRRPAPVRDPWD